MDVAVPTSIPSAAVPFAAMAVASAAFAADRAAANLAAFGLEDPVYAEAERDAADLVLSGQQGGARRLAEPPASDRDLLPPEPVPAGAPGISDFL